MNYAFLIAFSLFRTKIYMIYSVHCAAARAVCTCATPPPTHPVTINLYHFMGGVAHRLPLLHPESPLELICTPPVPLQSLCHRRLRVVGSSASAETPSSSPLHGRNKMTCCNQIHTVRLSDTHLGGLHTSWVHSGSTGIQYGELPWQIFRIGLAENPYFPTLFARCEAYRMRTLFKNVRPVCPQHGRGSQDDCYRRASP
jgi:hypothetical protein